jgi:hypothetical protein
MMTVTRLPERAWDGSAHIQKGLAILAKRQEQIYDFTAPAKTISSILDECSVSHIDFMSLDIEGLEHIALQGLDHKRHTVDFLCVEAVQQSSLDLIKSSLGDRFSVVEQLSHHDYLLKRNDSL